MSRVAPILAMLWEQWQLTRVEAAQRFGLGILLASLVLVLLDASKGATAAFWVLIFVHSFIWFSIAKLNGGKFADGYKPGFPLHLLFTRPVPTIVFVSVAMAYDTLSCVALYLVSAALLGFAFGQPLPLFSVVLCLASYHAAYACCQWSTRNRTVQWVGSIVFSLPLFFVLHARLTPTLQVDFSLIENLAMILLYIVSFALTVAGVARQRRGDAVAIEPQLKAGSGGFPVWLVSWFRFPCPTSSTTRAQLWFELRSSGLPVLMIGLGVAVLIFLLFAASVPFAPARNYAILVAIISVPITLFVLGGNAFGIRRKQGRTFASVFEATQPNGTAQLAGIKILVRAACVLFALLTIGMSLWASSYFVSEWGVWAPEGEKDATVGLLKLRQKIDDVFGSLPGYAHAAQVVLLSIVALAVIAWHAAREALRARHFRLVLVVEWLPAVWGLTAILLALVTRFGYMPASLVHTYLLTTFWLSGAALLLAAIYLFRNGFAQGALTRGYAGGALGVSAAFGAAWLAGMPATGIAGILWMMLAVLMIGLLAPWSLGRIRHT